HLWNIMICKAAVQAHLIYYMDTRAQLENYANWPWTRADMERYAAELRVLAKDALQHLWMFQDAKRGAEAEVFGKVTLIIVTTDMAVRLYGIRQNRLTWPAGNAAHATEDGHCPHHGRNPKVTRRDLHRFGKQYHDDGHCRRPRAGAR
ncbi:MAG: hypothetical protein ACKPKO_58330, partial [Candidatus Fonsibacter sp.]